jgi:hypothetical protein
VEDTTVGIAIRQLQYAPQLRMNGQVAAGVGFHRHLQPIVPTDQLVDS